MMTALLLLVSCVSDKDGSGQSSGQNDDWKEQDYGEATVLGNWHKITIFIADGDAQLHSAALKSKLTEWTGQNTVYMNSFGYPTDHDIILGYMPDRDVSVKAYALLDRMERESYFNARYLIYAEDGQLAIAYDKNEISNISVLTYAVDHLIKDYIDGKEYMAFAKGVVCTGSVDLIFEQELIDGVMLNEAWNTLAEVANPDIVAALKKYYTLYNDSLPIWLANLYAPGKMNLATGEWAGGFYGTPSGRDTQGYGPDITGTRQVLNLLESTGMLNNLEGGYGLHLPAQMKEDIIYMVKTLQDKNDGFFYHPQYDKEMMLSVGDLQRRGRDLNSATELLSDLGARPTYDTPTGVMGDGITADEMLENSISSLTINLGGSMEMAIARVVLNGGSDVKLTASDPTDEMLGSHDGFAAYLETVKINEESYTWGNQLNAIGSQIRTASARLGECKDAASPWYGKTLVDMLFDFLNARINPVTGMWEGVTTFRATNGFYKVISLYNASKKTFPMPQIAAEGLIAGLLGDQKSTGNICDVYNIWIGLSDLKSNVLNFSDLPKEERNSVIEYIDSALERDGAAAILNSYEKYLPYRYDDGSFSDNVGSSAITHNGLPVGLGLAEGDTNATAIAVAVVSQIYNAFGLSEYKVPLYTESDWMRFNDVIMGLGPVVKYSYLADDISQNFDMIDDGELASIDNITYTTGGVAKGSVVTEGENSYVKFEKFGIDNSGRVAVYGSRALGNVNTATIQFRMNVIESVSGRISVGINKYNKDATLHTVYFQRSGDNVMYDSISGWVDTGVDLEDWFNVKIVFFAGDVDCPMYLKTYINGNLMDIRSSVSKPMSANDVGGATLVPLYAWTGTLLYDDVVITRTKETPTPDEEPIIKPIVVPDYDYATEGGIHTFDQIEPGVIPSGCVEDEFTWTDGDVSEAQIVTDGTNKYFYFNKTGNTNSGSATFKFAEGATASNVLTVKVRMYVDYAKTGRISFNLKNSGGDSIKTFYFDVSGDYVRFEGVNGWTATGATIDDWIDLEFVYYEGPDVNNVYIGTRVNGTLIDVATTATKSIETEKITGVTFVPLYAFVGTVWLDDISLERTNETYDLGSLPAPETPTIPDLPTNPDQPVEPGAPDTPTEPEDFETVSGTQSFDNAPEGAIAAGYSNAYIKFTDGEVSTAAIVTDSDNKYLSFVKSATSASGKVDLMFAKDSQASNVLTVNFKMRIVNANAQRINFTLKDSNSTSLNNFYFSIDGTAVRFCNSLGEWVTTDATLGKWVDVKFVYYEGETIDNVYIATYVGGKLVDVDRSANKFLATDNLVTLGLTPLQAWTGTLEIDDVTFVRTNETYDLTELPEVPTEEPEANA